MPFEYVRVKLGCLGFPSVAVMKGVAAQSVPAVQNVLTNLRHLTGIVADDKKMGLCLVLVQLIQYPWGDFGMWAIIEGEIHTGPWARQSPNGLGK